MKVSIERTIFKKDNTCSYAKSVGYVVFTKTLDNQDEEYVKQSKANERMIEIRLTKDMRMDYSVDQVFIMTLCTFKNELIGLNIDDFKILLEMYSGERINEKSALQLMTILNRKDIEISYKSNI